MRASVARLVLLVAATGPMALRSASAQAADSAVVRLVERFAPAAIRQREQIHQHPELSNREVQTAELVAGHLRSLGFEVRTGIAHTGVVGILKGTRPGPVVAVRADMDALPVTETADLPFRSTARSTYLGRDVGVSHACGHDVHVAAALGTASVLAGLRDRMAGTVMFIFQPAEEGVPPGERGGAKLMVEEGVFASLRPDAVLAFHTNGSPPDEEGDDELLGKVTYTPGPAFAASTRWQAIVRGRSAHGAAPHLSVDPVVTAAQIVLALQTIRSRILSPMTPSVVTTAIIRGGDRNNIIPAAVELGGTIRSFDTTVQDTIEQRMRDIFAGITSAAHATFTLEFDRSHPVTVNNPALTEQLVPTLARLVGPDNIRRVPPETGAEDFSYFANIVPGFYFQIGVVPSGKVSSGHHTPNFYAANDAVPIGMRLMSTLVMDYLAAGTRR
jgi:amidohydrolase